MKLGYVPVDREKEAASKTLEYAYDDWTIARMAAALGRTDDQKAFEKRAASFRAVFDEKSGFMRARKSDGAFREPFDPLYAQYGSDYTEGNAWQYSWLVPQDPRGLFDRMGQDLAVQRLDHLFAAPAEVQNRAQLFGIYYIVDQWAPGNEHDLGAP